MHGDSGALQLCVRQAREQADVHRVARHQMPNELNDDAFEQPIHHHLRPALRMQRLSEQKRGASEAASFKSRGLTDADILEVLVNVVLNIFTNYTNHIAATEIDFPVVVLKRAA